MSKNKKEEGVWAKDNRITYQQHGMPCTVEEHCKAEDETSPNEPTQVGNKNYNTLNGIQNLQTNST